MEVKTYRTLYSLELKSYYAGFINGKLSFCDDSGIDIDVYRSFIFEEMERLKKLNLIVVEKVYDIA